LRIDHVREVRYGWIERAVSQSVTGLSTSLR
jgi:hypothetical protein